ncbi:MAG: hypothetical protein QY323_03555 [Patescibacteria group bacterium]|nr:MAG: hypothetical protein QY323_03555 [Patescibacteria group bacterium]
MRAVFITIFAWTTLAACGDNLAPPDAVDMTYLVQVDEIVDTCDESVPPADNLPKLDALLHADGRVELRHDGGWIPEPYSYPDLRVAEGGAVAYRATRDSKLAERSFNYEIDGTLTMEAVDLTFNQAWYRYEGNERVDCARTVRVRGPARAFHDATALEGIHQTRLSYYGEVCGDEPLPAEPLGSQVFLLNVVPTTTELRLNLDGMIYAITDLPAQGVLDWSGIGFTVSWEGIDMFTMRLKGVFRADLDALTMSLTPLGESTNCHHAYTIEGKKRVASLDAVSGDYRAQQHFWSECEGTEETHETPITVIAQSETLVEIRDRYGDWFVNWSEGRAYAKDGSEAEGLIASFEGRVDPPEVHYLLAYDVENLGALPFETDDGWCSYRLTVDGVSRYYPDLAWDLTAHDAPSSPRLSPTSACLPPCGTLGPLAP